MCPLHTPIPRLLSHYIAAQTLLPSSFGTTLDKRGRVKRSMIGRRTWVYHIFVHSSGCIHLFRVGYILWAVALFILPLALFILSLHLEALFQRNITGAGTCRLLSQPIFCDMDIMKADLYTSPSKDCMGTVT